MNWGGSLTTRATSSHFYETEMGFDAMTDAVLVDAIRTPGGKRGGQFRDWHPASLAALVLNGLVSRNRLDPEVVDDVIMGCVMQVGDQAANIARHSILAAGWPETVPGTTVDR